MPPGPDVSANIDACVIGVDFGTLSGRAVVVRVRDGAELAGAVYDYPHGVIERQLPATGAALPPNWALQLPDDWRGVLREAVPAAVAAAGIAPHDVIGIGTDFTACTVLPTLADGTPLCETGTWRDRPHAYPKLWKHHAAQGQADRVTAVARRRGEPWLSRYGGKISSEWQFAKALQVLDEDPEVYQATRRWIEAADWIVWQLCGVETRNVCTAGYKGQYQDGRYPSRQYLAELDPRLVDLVDDKLAHPLSPLGGRAGGLTATAAAWTGLPEGIAVAVGNVDAHVTSAAAQALEPGRLVAIMGTSTCHVLTADTLVEVPGMCGVVRDGVVSGSYGYEAGQSAVGDIFGWFVRTAVPASSTAEAQRRGIGIHDYLAELASGAPVGGHGMIALDWLGGNRSVLVDHDLSGVLVGLTLATRPEEIYLALIESTAFGTRTIVSAFEDAGVPVHEIIAAGGLLQNRFLMQVYADVLDRPLSVIASAQGPALGSAIHAAVAAGAYPDVRAASAAMGRVDRDVYRPDPARAAAYHRLYAAYRELHDHFGRGGSEVLHELARMRRAASGGE